MSMMKPSAMVSRTCGGWINISSTPLGFWEYWGIYRAKRRSGGTRGEHDPPGRAWASWRTLVGCALLGAPPGATRDHYVPSGP